MCIIHPRRISARRQRHRVITPAIKDLKIFHQQEHFSHSYSSPIHLFVYFITAFLLFQAHYIAVVHTNLGLRATASILCAVAWVVGSISQLLFPHNLAEYWHLPKCNLARRQQTANDCISVFLLINLHKYFTKWWKIMKWCTVDILFILLCSRSRAHKTSPSILKIIHIDGLNI